MVIQSSKREKNLKEDCLAIIKPGLWRTVFLDAAKNDTIFSRNK